MDSGTLNHSSILLEAIATLYVFKKMIGCRLLCGRRLSDSGSFSGPVQPSFNRTHLLLTAAHVTYSFRPHTGGQQMLNGHLSAFFCSAVPVSLLTHLFPCFLRPTCVAPHVQSVRCKPLDYLANFASFLSDEEFYIPLLLILHFFVSSAACTFTTPFPCCSGDISIGSVPEYETKDVSLARKLAEETSQTPCAFLSLFL